MQIITPNSYVQVASILASGKAFAALRKDGRVFSWGHPEYGGLANQELHSVQALHASSGAFAAILADGTVSTWGHALSGGDCRPVQGQLVEVQEVYVSNKAFAAVKRDGSVAPGRAR